MSGDETGGVPDRYVWIAAIIGVVVLATLFGLGLALTNDSPETDDVSPSTVQEPATEPAPETTETEPEPEPETTEPSSSELTTEEYEDLIRTNLESFDIQVDYVSIDENVVFLEYVTVESTEEGVASEMGYVAGSYAGAVDQGLEAEEMHVTILDAEYMPIGSFYVKRSWATQYLDGEMSEEEWGRKILNTLESNQ